MRMHSGKFTPNLVVGALSVFCLFVLYNYWTLSTVNHDLVEKVRGLEERLLDASRGNEALQASLSKLEEIKQRVEGNLKKEKAADEKAKEELAQKEKKIKELANDVENQKQAGQNCREELSGSESKVLEKEGEVTTLKAKVVSLEAQLVEKSNKVHSLEKEVEELKKKVAKGGSSTVSSPKSVDEVHNPLEAQPVLMNDPAVPYPEGWMKAKGPNIHPRHVSVKVEGDEGIARTRAMGPVIIFDPPNLPKKKARFSVMDQPSGGKKNEMKPAEGASHSKHGQGLPKPQQLHEETNGGEDFGPNPGVLPVPGQKGDQQQNLDAAEDDGDRPLKEDFGLGDDQSPDGALSHKDKDLNRYQAMQALEAKVQR